MGFPLLVDYIGLSYVKNFQFLELKAYTQSEWYGQRLCGRFFQKEVPARRCRDAFHKTGTQIPGA